MKEGYQEEMGWQTLNGNKAEMLWVHYKMEESRSETWIKERGTEGEGGGGGGGGGE